MPFPPVKTPRASDSLKRELDALPNHPTVDAIVNRFAYGIATKAGPRFPGCAVMVRENDKIVHIGCYGYANVEADQKLTPTTLFDLASVSKQFTAMAILHLIDEKQLDEENYISDFFPEFPGYAKDLQVKELIHHVGGKLPEYVRMRVPSVQIDENWYDAAMAKPDDWYPQMAGRIRREITNKDVLKWISSQEVLDNADGDFEYSNSGYVVLAELVERVAKMPFATFLKKHIFDPQGLDQTFVFDENSSFAKDAPEVIHHAVCYNRPGGQGFIPVGYTPFNFVYGDGNIHSNILDIAKWDLRLYDLERTSICTKTDHRKMLAARNLTQALSERVKDSHGKSVPYGAGWNVLESTDEDDVDPTRARRDIKKFKSRALYHRGEWLGWRAFIARATKWKIPEEGKNVHPEDLKSLGIVILSNNSMFNPCKIAREISRVYWDNWKNTNIMNRFNC